MEDESERMVCQSFASDFGDVTSSFKIVKNTTPYPASGEWILIASNQLTVTFEYGFAETSDVSDTAEMQVALSMEMELGIIFEKTKLNEETLLRPLRQLSRHTRTLEWLL